MQLALGGDPRTDVLRRLHAALIDRYGQIERQHEKREDPVWTLVQGVIGARSKTAISNAATDRLLERFGNWEAAAAAPADTLTEELQTQTFPAQSAERLKACLTAIMVERGEVDLRHLSNLPTEDAMAWLERLPGVARKISAGIMNTSRFQRRAIVIDSHHRRIMQRMGLVPPKADTTRAYDALMPVLPDEWTASNIDEHHLLVKKLGQTLCRPSEMRCDDCPARPDCATGRASAVR